MKYIYIYTYTILKISINKQCKIFLEDIGSPVVALPPPG